MSHEELINRLIEKVQKEGLAEDYPPLDEETVAECEKAINVKLPDLVRQFYSRVANGCVINDFMVMLPLYDESDTEEDVVSTYVSMLEASEEIIEDFDEEEGDVQLEWIPGMLIICDQGCGMRTVLDCNDPAGRMVEVDFDMGPVNYKEEWESDTGYFNRPGVSFEDWLKAWLEDKALSSGSNGSSESEN